MEFKREIIIEKPIDAVWDIIGNQFGDAYKWASGIKHSEGFGTPALNNAPCNNRACDLSSGGIKEVIREFDPSNFVLEYEVIEGLPSFVASGINHWQLTSVGSQTKVNMHLVIQTQGVVGKIMGPMMKMQMNGLTKSVLVDLKHFVETGKPSNKKAKEIEKSSRRAA